METVVVTGPPRPSRQHYSQALDVLCHLVFLTDLAGPERSAALGGADILIAGHVANELKAEDRALMQRVRFVQLLHAGTDHTPFGLLPEGVPVACTRGKGAPPMSEHVVGMALACSRRLLVEDRNMRQGQFNMYSEGLRVLAGGACAILGYGGVGRAAARVFRAMGMHIHAIDRAGCSDEVVDFFGTLDCLDAALKAADLIVVTLPLTKTTAGLIGARELGMIKDDAILVNVSRAEIFDEGALYRHLATHPRCFAGLDVWWVEPLRHGQFRTDYPFLDLGNVVASPHNSAQAERSDLGLSLSLDNVIRVLQGNPPQMLVSADEKVL